MFHCDSLTFRTWPSDVPTGTHAISVETSSLIATELLDGVPLLAEPLRRRVTLR